MNKNRIVIGVSIFIMAAFILSGFFIFNNNEKISNIVVAKPLMQNDGKVLGLDDVRPTNISISKIDVDSYGSGGIISQTTSSESAVMANLRDNKSQTADVNIYKASKDDLVRYILHNENGNQLNPDADIVNMKLASSYSANVVKDDSLKIALPDVNAGIWLVSVSTDGEKREAFVIRSSFGAIVNNGDDKLIFWAQDFNSKKKLAGVKIDVYNFQDKREKIDSIETDGDGIGILDITTKAEVAFMEKDGELAVLPINREYLNYSSFEAFAPKKIDKTFFVFTDRPIYQPGDKVNFKAIVRADDDARLSIPDGEIQVDVSQSYYSSGQQEKVYSQKLKISETGAVSGDFVLPKTLKTGSYYVSTSMVTGKKEEMYNNIGSTSFNVEHYQKPDYGVDLNSEKNEIINGENLNVKIQGNYFSGQPLAGKNVKYRVYANDFYHYGYYSDYESNKLDDAEQYYYGYGNGTPLSEGVAILDSSGSVDVQIGNDITAQENGKFRDRILTVETEFSDESGIPVYDAKNILVDAGSYSILRTDYKYGYRVGDQISLGLGLVGHDDLKLSDIQLDGDINVTSWKKVEVSGTKYPKYETEKSDLPKVSIKTDQQGKANLAFNASKEGSYEITVSGVDKRGNIIKEAFNVWVSDKSGFFWGNDNEKSGLKIKTDRDKYNPDEIVKLNISSDIPDRDVFLAMERGRVNRYQVIHVSGNSTVVDMPLVETDMPNIFAAVSSFSYDNFDAATVNIKVSTDSRKVTVAITADKDKYNPGDQVNVNVKTTNTHGDPISAEVAVWGVDKAIYELAANNSTGIFKAFWYERYNDTNQNHSLMGIISEGAEKGGGGGGGDGRSIFKDTVYWNPTVKTGSDGVAKISFKLPDNLTTWVMAGIADTENTSVGEGKKEIIVSKDVIMRPILPNIFRVDDSIMISSLVHNFTDKKIDFKVALKMDNAEIDSQIQSVSVDAKSEQQIFWRIKPIKEMNAAQLTFSAVSDQKNLSDVITKEVPVRKFGFWENKVNVRQGDEQTYQIKLAPDTDKEKTSIRLSIAPTLLGTLPEAMKYLVEYPYGCVEQTTSRFVPAVIAKENPAIFKNSIASKNIDDIINKGIEHLGELQSEDGGWGWYGENSDPFMTAYVIEYLVESRKIGFAVNQAMMNDAKAFLEGDDENIKNKNDRKRELIKRDGKFAKVYALSLLDPENEKGKEMLSDFNGVTTDILAMGVLANLRNNYTDPNSNGLSQLISMSKDRGDGLFWPTGLSYYFGSDDASTALAVRAIIASGQNKDIAARGVRFLTAQRKSNYWSNTFATANAIKAVVEYSKINTEINPQYSYSVFLDDNQIESNTISKFNQLNDILIPVEKIKTDGSVLSIRKNGDGELYSTLTNNEFLTDRNSSAASSGLTVERKYVNITNPGQNLHVGDTVQVVLTVAGLASEREYAVLQDELPSGLVPINMHLKNQQFDSGGDSNFDYYSYNQEITENGMIMTTYRIKNGENVYAYNARVANEGTFSTPPAIVELMYSPEIFGRSKSETVTIDNGSFAQINSIAKSIMVEKKSFIFVLFILIILIVVGGIGFMAYRKYIKEKIAE